MTTASFNYTGRKRITHKQFHVQREAIDEESKELKLTIWVEQKLLDSVEDSESIVLDVLHRGHERFELKCTEHQRVRPEYLLRESSARYRLSVVNDAGDLPGKIRTSSDVHSLVPLPEDNHETHKVDIDKQTVEHRENFFNPEPSSDLGSRLWHVDFQDTGDVRVLINTRLLDIYDGDKKNPMLRGFMLQPMVREIFSGIFMRVPDLSALEDSDTEKWFKWAEYVSDDEMPEEAFAVGGQVAEEWLGWLDSLMEKFMSLPVVLGKHSLLQAMEDHSND